MSVWGPQRRRLSGWAKLLLGLAVAVAVALMVLFHYVHGRAEHRDREERAVCMRSVNAREDNRAMWDYLIRTTKRPRSDPEVVKFRLELDRRLPHLHCNDSNSPVPVDRP